MSHECMTFNIFSLNTFCNSKSMDYERQFNLQDNVLLTIYVRKKNSS